MKVSTKPSNYGRSHSNGKQDKEDKTNRNDFERGAKATADASNNVGQFDSESNSQGQSNNTDVDHGDKGKRLTNHGDPELAHSEDYGKNRGKHTNASTNIPVGKNEPPGHAKSRETDAHRPPTRSWPSE